MIKETQAEIYSLIMNYNQAITDVEIESDRKKLLEEEFLRKFEKIKNEVILPVMKEVGNYLEANGQSALIGDHFENRAIFLNIFPGRINHHAHPSISFIGSESDQKISIHTKSFMPQGCGEEKYLGEFELKDLTKEFVEKKIVNLIKESFNRDWKSNL